MTPIEAALKAHAKSVSQCFDQSFSGRCVSSPLADGGLVGRLFREFAVVLSTAILVSLVVSLTTTPMMCARCCGIESRNNTEDFFARAKMFASAAGRVRTHFAHGAAASSRHPDGSFDHLAVNVFLFSIVPKGFFPQQDNGTIFGGIQGAQDASFPTMQSAARGLSIWSKKIRRWTTLSPLRAAEVRPTAALSIWHSSRSNNAKSARSTHRSPATQTWRQCGERPSFVQAGQDLRIGGRQSNAQFQYTIQSDNLVTSSNGARFCSRV